MSSQVVALRELLEQRFPGALPLTAGGSADPLATGIGALDRLLPGGGLPRGRLTLWAPGGGATALLTAACRTTVARGERAAWVDAAGTMAGAFWRVGPALLRPAGRVEALACAEELLRSGGFALVVLSGLEVGEGAPSPAAASSVSRARARSKRKRWRSRRRLTEAAPAPRVSEGALLEAGLVRLSRVAREGGGALVVCAGRSPVAALRVRSRLAPEAYRWRRGPFGEPAEVEAATVCVRAASPGWSAETRCDLAVSSDDPRAALDPGLVDRRGSAGGSAGAGAGATTRRRPVRAGAP